DVADLAWLDGETYSPNGGEAVSSAQQADLDVWPATASTLAAEPPRANAASADFPAIEESVDEETRRWLALKGLSFGLLDEVAGSASPPRARIEDLVDPEALRFAQTKGLSLDWFLPADGDVEAPVQLVAASADPGTNGATADGWITLAPEEEGESPDAP